MKWKVIRITTTVEAEDYLSSILCDLGFEGIEIQDSMQLSEMDRKRMFIDIPPELDENDTTAVITCYMDEDASPEEKIALIEAEVADYAAFVDFGAMQFEIAETEDKDWINNWKKFFKPFRIGDSIVIKPTWETLDDVKDGDMVIEIDPGTAFGTGSHETTWLCIENLQKYLREGDSLLDVGCGSGILSIIGKKLGAAYCIGTDIDPIAVDVSKENAEVNHLTLSDTEEPGIFPGTVSYFAGNVIGDDAFLDKVTLNQYDVVVANILADVIIPLAPVVRKVLKPGGIFISSGIINMKEEEVRAALISAGYTIKEVCYRKDWVSFVATA